MTRAFSLETRNLTLAYWGAVFAFTLAFYVTPYLPLIDYHQHVAVGAILHRMFDKSAPEHALYDTNLITYNGGFHLFVAWLSYLMPPFHAGRVVMSAYPFLFAFAALSVAKVAKRPSWYAFLALPICYSRGMAWGFANWNLTFPVAVIGITWFLRLSRGEKKMWPRLLFLSCFCAYGHVLAMLCLCAGIAVAQLTSIKSLGETWRSRLLALSMSPLPVLPGVLWCGFVYWHQTHQTFTNWTEAQFDGLDDPLWFKLRHLLSMSTGNFWDLSDVGLLGGALVGALILANAGERDTRSDDLTYRRVKCLAIAFFCFYLIIPKVFVATWFVYERFPAPAMLFLVGALPNRKFAYKEELAAALAAVGVAAALNTLRVWSTMGDTGDALAILRLVPANKKLLMVNYDPVTERISREVYVHLPVVYQAWVPGEIAYTFTKFESMPVHYRPGKAPPTVQPGFEWDGGKYDPTSAWARAYDVTLVRAGGDDDPAVQAFRGEAWRVKPLARRGRFFLYDTSDLGRSD